MAFARVAVLSVLVFGSATGSVFAQVSTLQPGATVFVKPVDGGAEWKGRLIEFGPERLTLLVKDQRVTVPADRVQSIDLHGDSLKNGAIIGAAIYGGFGLIGMSQDPQIVKQSWFVPVLLIQVGLGAAIGSAFDAMHKGRTPLYRRTTTVGLLPVRKGAAIMIGRRF